MFDPDVVSLQNELRSAHAPMAWKLFLEEFSPVLYQVAQLYSNTEDDASDCFLYICEQLARNGFRRLLKFKPDGNASFITWLRVVARNLCFDWYRHQNGRPRTFSVVQRRSSLEADVYRCRFERGMSESETIERLRMNYPGLNLGEVVEIERQIQHTLTSRQRWILATRWQRATDGNVSVLNADEEDLPFEVADPRFDQEHALSEKQQHLQLQKHVARLSPGERLILQLRFEGGLSLEQIARLAHLGDAQRVHRRLSAVLKKLRAAIQ
jgi:RNA polymerase sigma factor (sigma-70 family)